VWQTLGPWLGTGGLLSFVSALLWQARRWHNDAVNAERRRADESFAAYEKLWSAYLLREQQLAKLLGREAPQRETS
jgi:hypothetical protein